MSKADAWSVKGVGAEARQVAEEAARRSGLSVADWLDRIIADGAAELGIDAQDLDAQDMASNDRLEALTAKLARLPAAGAANESGSKRQREWRHLRTRTESLRDTLADREAIEPRASRRQPAADAGASRNAPGETTEARLEAALSAIEHAASNSRRAEPAPRERAVEARLEATIDAIQRKVSAQDEQTAQALANLARWIQTNEAMRGSEREALSVIADRLVQLEQHIAQRSSDAGYEPIRAALSKLEARIDTLAHRATDATSPDAVDEKLRELGRGLTGLTDKIARLESNGSTSERAEHFARLESKLATILASLDRPRPQITEAIGNPPIVAPNAKSAGAPLNSIDIAVAEIAKRQRALDEASPPSGYRRPRLPIRRDPPASAEAAPSLDFRAFDERLEAIADRIERAADLASAKSQSQSLAQTNTAFETLRDEIARLGSRLEESRQPSPHPEVQLLRDEIADLSRALAGLASRDSVGALDSAVRSLAARIESSREDGVRESLLAPIERVAADLHTALAEIDPRRTVDALDREIKSIAAKLDQMAVRDFDPEAFSHIHDQTQEIRDLLKAAAQRPMPIERMERQIALLGSRLDEALAQGVGQSASQPMVAASEDLRALLQTAIPAKPFAALEARVEALAGKIEEALSRPPAEPSFVELNQRLERVQSTLQQQSSKAPDTRQLEAMILRLAETVEQTRQPDGDAAAFEALEAQIAQVAARLDRSDANIAAIGSLEHAIGDLFGRLEEARQAAVEAAETAAHTAAKEALRQAMAASPGQTAPQIDKISREIVDLRSTQDDADRRIHATLSAVHETLEKVVDRLASLEQQPKGQPMRAARRPEEPAAAARSALDFVLGRRETPAEPPRQPAQPPAANPAVDAPDFLIEPGSGFTPRRAENALRGLAAPQASQAAPAEAEAEPTAQSSFIAAARRAAQAAAAEAAAASAVRVKSTGQSRTSAAPKAGIGAADQVRAFVSSRKRPILLGLAGLVILFGAYAVLRGVSAPRAVDADKPAQPSGQSQASPPAVEPAKRSSPQALLEAPDAVLPEVPKPPAAKPAPTLPGLAAAGQAFDMSSTGSIGPAPSTFTPNLPARANEATPHAALSTDPPPTSVSLPLRDAALSGNAAAQYELATRLAEGRQMARDPKAAAEWFSRAAAQGLAPAQFRLGVAYEKGLGFAQDLPLAKAWYERAANVGNAHAMHNLAVVLAEGAGGKPNYAQAAIWFRKAAEFGIRDSQYNLAILYARGLGIEQDFGQSYVWFSLAAAQGDDDAAKKRDDVAKRLDAVALAAAKVQVGDFHAKQPDRTVNEVAPPPGGWDPIPKPDIKSLTPRPKVSAL